MWLRRAPSPEVEAALSRVQIFSALRLSDLEKLAAACLLRRYSAGEAMIEEGSTGLGMFLITAGRVEVFKTRDGHKVLLAVLGSGDVLGEMALLDDQPRSASAVAIEHTECLLLSRDRFRTLLKRRPRIAWPIVPSLARRVRDLQEQLLEAQNRTPAVLPRLAHAGGTASLVNFPEGTHPTVIKTLPPAPEHLSTSHSSPGETDDCSADSGCSDDDGCSDDSGSTGDSDSGADVLRAPYALIMTGAVGFGESARLCEVFLRSLDDASGLADGRPMGDVVRDLPRSLATAGMSSWDQGRRLPSKLLETFRDHLRSDWHGEDPD